MVKERRPGHNPVGRGALKSRVKTARGRKLASTRWLERQLNDPYVAAAKREGLRSRAAFKLMEIDDAQGLLKPGQCVVDLGAAPGGWSQVAAQRVKASGEGRVIAVDISEMEPIADVDFLQLDFTELKSYDALAAKLSGSSVDLVLSDMAAPATGHKQTDHLRVIALCEVAFDFAKTVLVPSGTFLCKALQGGTEQQLLVELKRCFKKVRHVKPRASRADSSELYVLAQGFAGSSNC
jgi:23S rRNA (uridine2552-2'-O)-methyltransferase